MATVTFDTLEYANALKKANVPDGQAQAQAQALRHAFEAALSVRESELATKSDIELLRKEIEISNNDLLIKLGSGLIVGLGIILAAMRWMPHA